VPVPVPPGEEPVPPSDGEKLIPPPTENPPPRRFYGARQNLGSYVQSGDYDKLSRALGRYSQTGMGGATATARRMQVSTQTAASLFGFMQAVAIQSTTETRTWVSSLLSRNANAQEIADEIVSTLSANGGSLDEASAQNSIALALEDLLLETPEVDLLNLDEDAIWSLVSSFLGHELFNRVYLDIGQAFESADLPGQTIEQRKNGMREYIQTDVYAQIEEARQSGASPTHDDLSRMFTGVLQRTLFIYEGAVE